MKQNKKRKNQINPSFADSDEIKTNELTQIVVEDPFKKLESPQDSSFPLTLNPSEPDPEGKKVYTYNRLEDNILKLISKSKCSTLINHQTAQELLFYKWRSLPRFIYNFNLLLYAIFLVFYSINIFIYDGQQSDLISNSEIICLILLSYFMILEIMQLINSFRTRLLLIYWLKFKNILEMIDFPLCILTLVLPNSESKSALFSATILMTYCIFILRLDKFYGMGPFINVFGKIIKRSVKIFLISLIILIGFLIAFKNRSNYYLKINANNNQTSTQLNKITTFEGEFLISLYTILIMLNGNMSPTGMGIDHLNSSSLINFLIYGLFIFLMPILLINIFTGISIDEIRKLIDNSKIEVDTIKIDYIYTLESFNISKYLKWMEILLDWVGNKYNWLVKFFFKLKYLQEVNDKYKIKLKFDANNEDDEENDIKKMIIRQETKTKRLLIEFNQVFFLIQNKFDFIDKRIEKFMRIDEKMERMDERIERIVRIDEKMEKINKRMELISLMSDQYAKLNENMKKLDEKMDKIDQRIIQFENNMIKTETLDSESIDLRFKYLRALTD